MKCLLCKAFGPITALMIEDVTLPSPGPGHVLIDVRAASLNYPDALMVQGMYQVKPTLPFVPGSEYAGVVSAVGDGVTHPKAGDRVAAFGLGGFGEYAFADAKRVISLPPGLDFDTAAAFFLTYCTSLHGLKDCGHMAPGETLLVLGASGGVGLAAVEIGKAMGARVIAAASSQVKLDLCKRLGADELVNYETESLRDRVNAITGGRGVDVVYDPVGGRYTEEALRATAWRGRLLVVGFAAGDIPRIPLNLALLKERSIVGVYWVDSVARDPAGHIANVNQLLDWLAAGKVKPHISERVPLTGVSAAMQRMSGRRVMGKVVVHPRA
jgi:NADPH2:quinone reductase